MKTQAVLAAVTVAAMLAIVLLTVVQPAWADLSCGVVTAKVFPCLDFLTGKSDEPSPNCCSGVQSLKATTPTTPDRQAACECLKSAAAQVPGLQDDKASQLPKRCGVEISFPISKDVDCKTIP